MTRFDAAGPRERGALLAEAITAHRKRDSDETVFEAYATAEASGGDVDGLEGESSEGRDDAGTDAGERERRHRLTFADGQLTFTVTERQRERLDDVLAEFPVFKIAQPETRTADDETVVVSAVTDPKHAAEFVETALRSVYGLSEDYRLWVVSV